MLEIYDRINDFAYIDHPVGHLAHAETSLGAQPLFLILCRIRMIGMCQQPFLQKLCDGLWKFTAPTLLSADGGGEICGCDYRRLGRWSSDIRSGSITIRGRGRRRVRALGRCRSWIRGDWEVSIRASRIDMQLWTTSMMIDWWKVVCW